MIEEWDFLYTMNQAAGAWNSFPGAALSDLFAARPLQLTPYAIGRFIDHHSFIGFHLILILSCFIRVISGASIGYFLLRNRAYALAIGLLFLVFPADTQQMTFRTMSICLAVGLASSGAALSLRGVVARGRRQRIVAVLVGSLASCLAALMYEGVIALYVMPILLLAGRYGIKCCIRIIHRRSIECILWLIAPAINVLYLAWAMLVAKSAYQLALSQHGILQSIIENRQYLFKTLAYRAFFEAWRDTIEIWLFRVAHYGYLLVLAAAVIAILYIVPRRNVPRGIGGGRAARLILAGLMMAIAAFMPYMVSTGYMLITQRTFISVAPGASVAIIVFIAFVAGRFERIGVLLTGVIVYIGFVAQLYQFDVYTRSYVTYTRPYMSMIVDRVDDTKPVHLVNDDSGVAGYYSGMYITKVRAGPADRLQNTDGFFELCMDAPPTTELFFATCKLKAGVWYMTGLTKNKPPVSAQEVQVIRIGRNFDSHYMSRNSTWNDRASFTPRDSLFKPDANNLASYKCDADSDWGYSGFCRGVGWSNGRYREDVRKSYFLAVNANPNFLFDLDPIDERYTLSIKTLGMSEYVKSNLFIEVNGNRLSSVVIFASQITAFVPRSILNHGLNTITLHRAKAEGESVDLPINQISLLPVNSQSTPH
ncbi:hypothetical protein LMG29542_03769 [Paraburkholderia humisilvae]|uniref:Glycosyltransferase RgtA/B/C/D-like domain-containing protein n=2 Tax=Paraburkholderia humisilvae TaxID=627669 RepID=A0A6J5E3D3_9BURK|nr:hypothetical protein LMG29542_03769 [Paraburkholderia humisilvae]